MAATSSSTARNAPPIARGRGDTVLTLPTAAASGTRIAMSAHRSVSVEQAAYSRPVCDRRHGGRV